MERGRNEQKTTEEQAGSAVRGNYHKVWHGKKSVHASTVRVGGVGGWVRGGEGGMVDCWIDKKRTKGVWTLVFLTRGWLPPLGGPGCSARGSSRGPSGLKLSRCAY